MRIFSVGLMIGRPDNGFQTAMRKVATGGYMDMQCTKNSDFNQALIREVRAFKPDLVFIQFQQEGVITDETAKELSSLAFVINFSGDVRQQLPSWYIQIGKHIQLSTFTNMVDVDKCRVAGLNADYLEIGIDPNIYKKRNVIQNGFPKIVAHFNHYQDEFPLSQYRMDVVRKLTQMFGNDFGVFGNFPSAIGNFNSDQDAESVNYNKAQIAINVSHFNFNQYSSDRMLRILGSGTFCLSHRFTGIEERYTIGKHLDIFDDLDDLISKCQFYLKEEKIREQIAQNGHDLIQKNFTFDSMCENIVLLYKKQKNEQKF